MIPSMNIALYDEQSFTVEEARAKRVTLLSLSDSGLTIYDPAGSTLSFRVPSTKATDSSEMRSDEDMVTSLVMVSTTGRQTKFAKFHNAGITFAAVRIIAKLTFVRYAPALATMARRVSWVRHKSNLWFTTCP